MSEAEKDVDPGALDRLLGKLGFAQNWYQLELPEDHVAMGSYTSRALLNHPAVAAITKAGRLRPLTTLLMSSQPK